MELTGADKDSSAKKKYSEIFDEQFPFYLSLGMTVDEYWEGDVTLPYFFRQSYREKHKQELEHENLIAWLQGQYIAEAIATCLAKNHNYPKEPYNLQKEEEPKTEAEKQIKVQNAAAGFAAFVAMKNTQMRKLRELETKKEEKISAKTENNEQS